MEKITVWSLDNEKAVLLIDGDMVSGTVEYFRGKLTIKAENGKYYDYRNLI